jgi:hypothetical protein
VVGVEQKIQLAALKLLRRLSVQLTLLPVQTQAIQLQLVLLSEFRLVGYQPQLVQFQLTLLVVIQLLLGKEQTLLAPVKSRKER